MAGKALGDRFSKIIDDLERITGLIRRGEPGHRKMSLEDIFVASRGELGGTVSLEYFRMVRLLAFHEMFGTMGAKSMYAAGEKVGKALAVNSLEELIAKIRAMGLARAETAAPVMGADGHSKIMIKFYNSAVASGVPLLGGQICHFECGIIAGALARLLDKKVIVTESKCVAMGYDYCQFDADVFEKGYKARIGEEGTGITEYADYSEENVQLLSTLAAHAVTALENALLYEHTKKMVITDPLTNTYNYGYFQTRLREEIQRSERLNHSFTLVMADIDEFKSLNDQYGHPGGDGALKEIARIMKESIRGIDIVCRYGGDEFALIFPQTDKTETVTVIERMRSEIEKRDFGSIVGEDAPLLKLSASFGCAVYPADSRYSEQLIAQADQALYAAKKSGRNRICFFSDKQDLPSPPSL
ncbi:MAG: diguanylate cyclase [Endomicrobiales bacterium]